MKNFYIAAVVLLCVIFSAQAQVTLSHSNSSDINTLGRAFVLAGGEKDYLENYFYRVYNLNSEGITGDFQISDLQYGQGKAREGKEIVLRIYTISADDITNQTVFDSKNLIGSATHTSLAADDLSLISKTVSLNIPAGSIILYEVYAAENADGLGTNDTTEDFLPGFNISGETDESYIFSNSTPQPNMSKPIVAPFDTTNNIAQEYVMNIVGSEVLSTDNFGEVVVSLSPNPTRDVVNIRVSNSNDLNSIKVYDITGKLVLNKSNSSTINLSHLKTGMYILELSTNKGNAIKRIVKY